MDGTSELDLTNHHDNIVNGIQTIKKIYNISSSEAKSCVEAAYIEKIAKIPSVLPYYQESSSYIKSLLLTLKPNSTTTQFSFTLLKCLHATGQGWLEIEGFSEKLILNFNPPSFQYSQNEVSEVLYKIYSSKTKEIAKKSVNLWKILAKLNIDQIAYCKNLVVFENLKNEEADCCFFISIELSIKDRIKILTIKLQEISATIERLRIDSQGFNIKNEFKPSCCECFIM